MLHSCICCNEDGYVLLARYFQAALPLDERKRYESHLAQVCAQIPHLWEKIKKDAQDQFVVCDGQFVVLRQVGELRVFLAGNSEYDELILSDIMGVLHSVLVTQLEKKLTEASFFANYAKVVVALDEMVQQGHLENMDEASIEQMSKLRPYPTK
uniref:Coatomer subunit zeta n=1 Tax=Globisporangium ultimum (strain ATCC 200006 / CBS 805.95 / DAOM BR144) TaxID=431595 RepID=K3X9H2_GLOUD